MNWSVVAPRVVTVVGTSLRFSDTGERSETGWPTTGGGLSSFTPAPAYQRAVVPGFATPTFHGVADVAMNADPATGQYVVRIERRATGMDWCGGHQPGHRAVGRRAGGG